MSDLRTEKRAERLRVLVAAIGEEPTMDVRDTFALGLVPGGWEEYLSDDALALVQGDMELDVDLAFQCVALAHAIRARQWVALERADALVAAREGAQLPPTQQGALARAILELGWNSTPEEE